MAITRRSLFGIPPAPTQGSTNTWRAIPLTQGVVADTAWPIQPPGSAASMSNFVPLDGVLVPRSRLSSLNTIRVLDSALGMAVLFPAATQAAFVWYSNATCHAHVTSNGSISRASFVSAAGLGVAGITSAARWQYALTFMANISDNAIVAASSQNTLMVLYHTSGSFTGPPLYSYLTSAPQALAVGNFDNYVIAFNTREANSPLPTRVRWCVRGNPSNWTSEGSGFEDLLEMRGNGTAVKSMADGRFLLFSDREIWYGVGATYPAQFTFNCLDHNVGCIVANTIVETEDGLLFLGSDNALRLIPRGGGPSQIVFPALIPILRPWTDQPVTSITGFGVYDPLKKLYHLFLEAPVGTRRGIVINTRTGEWGYEDFNDTAIRCGIAMRGSSNHPATSHEGIFFGNSNATVYSMSSLLAQEAGSNVTARWQSPPISPELAGNYKQVTKVCADYRATSKSTVTVKLSQDGGNTYESTGALLSLVSAPVSGRVELDVYRGGAFPAIELTSQSTGFELHRLDVTMNIGGRK